MKVAVIGAGVFGVWTARWLRRRGAEVTVIDAYGPGNSLASSGDESRVTRSAHGSDEHYPRWQRHSLEQYRELERASGQTLFVNTGVLWFAHGEAGFEADSLATLTRLDIPAERWATDELQERYPQIGSADIDWALHEPEAGALMARRGVAVAAEALVREGGDVRIGLALAPSQTNGAGADLTSVLLTDGSRLTADVFVFACGPWLAKLFPEVVGPELTVVQQEIIYFATPPGDDRFDAGNLPIWVDYDRAFYGIPSIERRGFKCAPDWPGPFVDPDRQERRISDERIAASRTFLAERFPALKDQPVSEGRVCQYELTADTHFIIDRHPEWPNAWVVGGGSGHGYKHGPALGEYLSARVLGDEAAAAPLAPPDDRFALRRRAVAMGMRTSGKPPTAQDESSAESASTNAP